MQKVAHLKITARRHNHKNLQ